MSDGLFSKGMLFKCQLIESMIIINILHLSQATFNNMAANIQPLFTIQSSTNSSDTHNQNHGKKESIQLDFISQFLELPYHQPSDPRPEHLPDFKQLNCPLNRSQTSLKTSSNFQNPVKEKRCKSMFHNFQKHLITTLKLNIKMNKANLKKDLTVTLAQEMWKSFLESRYFSKKVLYFIFGVTASSKDQTDSDIKGPIFPEFSQIMQKYSEFEISLAQEYLRNEVVRQGRKLSSKHLFERRRMEKSDEFESYFFKFIEELQQGPISRRMPKSNKLELLKEMVRIKDESF